MHVPMGEPTNPPRKDKTYRSDQCGVPISQVGRYGILAVGTLSLPSTHVITAHKTYP